MKNENISEWYDLKPGGTVRLDENNELTRVPGGWVLHNYLFSGNSYKKNSVFIPYSDEFLNGANGKP